MLRRYTFHNTNFIKWLTVQEKLGFFFSEKNKKKQKTRRKHTDRKSGIVKKTIPNITCKCFHSKFQGSQIGASCNSQYKILYERAREGNKRLALDVISLIEVTSSFLSQSTESRETIWSAFTNVQLWPGTNF